MKKSLVLVAMAGVALASCVNDVADVAQNQEQKKVKIAFDTPVLYNNAESRANFFGEIGSHQYTQGGTVYSYPKEENFIIYAVAHEGSFTGWKTTEEFAFNNTSIGHDVRVDGWAPKKSDDSYYYWPSGKLMTFAASSPADLAVTGVNRTYGATGLTITDFEIAGDASKQYDLLFSKRSVNKSSADMSHSASYYSGVALEFQHALSSIRFSLSNTSGETVVLTKISLYGVKYKGNFAENLTEGTDKTIYDRDGNDANVSPAWDLEDDLVAATTPYVGFSGTATFPESPKYVSEVEGMTGTCSHLLLMPQELTGEVQIKVDYTVNGEEAHKIVTLDGLKDLNNHSVDEWIMGVRYTYRLVYDAASADKDKIYFAPSTDAWIEHDVVVVPLI